MKPMTIEQEACMLAYKKDTTEENRWNLYHWQTKVLARQILLDAGKNIGAKLHASR